MSVKRFSLAASCSHRASSISATRSGNCSCSCCFLAAASFSCRVGRLSFFH
ncbi:hypothetical protein 2204_scaffold14_00064 [Bacteriophage sp.]|nr:hypothetical protein 2204_scaffold14_00064 [Bacteriophage sp.]